jgi:hypothetical protein
MITDEQTIVDLTENPYKEFETDSKPVPTANLHPGGIDELIERARMDYSKTLPAPEIALRVNGEVLGTLGNFSVITGKAKSKKTFAVTLAIAGALGKVGVFEGCLPPDKNKVILFDTEQGEWHVLQVAKRVMRLLNKTGTLENFDVFKLRDRPTEIRKQIVERVIQTTPGLGLVVIDGIKDLVKSINDEAEATGITDWLMRLSDNYHCHIITVLHQNKTDTRARGHIGTEIINKGEMEVSVQVEKQNKDVSKVEVENGRWKHFDPFAFMIGENGLPEVVSGWKPKDEDKGRNKGISPVEIDVFKHQQILHAISQKSDKHTNAELIERIQLAVSEFIEQIGTTKAKTFKMYYQDEGYIKHHGKERTAGAYYTINLNPDERHENDEIF